MTVAEAVRQRILNLCDSREITINKLAMMCGTTQSTINNIVTERNNASVSTIKKICDGLEITIADFFNDDIFYDLEQEVK